MAPLRDHAQGTSLFLAHRALGPPVLPPRKCLWYWAPGKGVQECLLHNCFELHHRNHHILTTIQEEPGVRKQSQRQAPISEPLLVGKHSSEHRTRGSAWKLSSRRPLAQACTSGLWSLAWAVGSAGRWSLGTLSEKQASCSQGSNHFQSSDFIPKHSLIVKYSGAACAHVSHIWAHFTFILFNLL